MADEITPAATPSSQGTLPLAASPSPAVATPAPSPASTATATTTTQTAPSRPDWLPEKFFDAAAGPKWDDFGKHFNEVATRDAAEQVRKLSLPAKPEDYKLDLPKDFKLPAGVEFKMDPAKPEYAKLQQMAVKHGLSQDAVTDLLGTYAETLVGSEAAIQTARQAEITKLGANGPARVTAVNNFFNGLLGADKAKAISSMMVTSGIVEAMESLVAKFSTQGAATFSQSHRATPDGNNKIAGYDQMSFEQRRFAQDQRAQRRAG